MFRIIFLLALCLYLVTDKARCQTDADTTYSTYHFERVINGSDTTFFFVTTKSKFYSSRSQNINADKEYNAGLNAARAYIKQRVADVTLQRDKAIAEATKATDLVTRLTGLKTDLESVATGSTPAPRQTAPPPPTPVQPIEAVQIPPPTFNANGTVTYSGATWKFNSKTKKWRRL